jgi:hypothetical protein
MSELSQKLRVGMTLAEAEAILGPPSSQMGGGDILGMFANVSGSARAISSMSRKRYIVWRRPEGEYQLVFVGNTLGSLHSTP